MALDEDLSAAALAEAMPERAARSYPALLSTEAEAMAWARSDAPAGAVVVAGYQVSPRGRSGLPWETRQGRDLAFSVILRPELHPTREGWLYAIAIRGVVDTLPEGTTIVWPDEAYRAGDRVGAVGVQVELSAEGIPWAVVNVFVPDVESPRTPLLSSIVEAIEARQRATVSEVRKDYLAHCETISRPVRARLIPLGPAGPKIEGTAADVLSDGALTIRTAKGNRVACRPQNLGMLDVMSESEAAEAGITETGSEAEPSRTEATQPEAAQPGNGHPGSAAGNAEPQGGQPGNGQPGDGPPRDGQSGDGR